MVILGVRMIITVGVIVSGDVVPQHKVKFINAVYAAGNGRDCVVRNTVGFCKNKRFFIGIATSFNENFFGEFRNNGGIFAP